MATTNRAPDFSEITHITFDCYGTLIDWEAGILRALQPILTKHAIQVEQQEILRLYVAHEARLESGRWRPYVEILQLVSDAIAADLDVTFTETERTALPASLPLWLPFPDTVPALRRLREKYSLGILSNTDDALFASTARHLEVPFDEIITAEQIHSYKPGEAHFSEALRRLKIPVHRILHVAQSLYHDHVPAMRLGFRTAWVNRPSLLGHAGLAPEATVKPDFEVTNLRSLADFLTGTT